MSVLRKETQVANNRTELIINRKNQEKIMMQQEVITALRSSNQKLEAKYQENIKELQQQNTILLRMIEQQQQLLNKTTF